MRAVKCPLTGWMCMVETQMYMRLNGPDGDLDTPAWWMLDKEKSVPTWNGLPDTECLVIEKLFPDMEEKKPC